MNRRFLLLFCLLLAGLPAFACGKTKQEGRTPTKALADIYAEMEAANVLPEMLSLSADVIEDDTGIMPADCRECIFRISRDGLRADEVVLLRAADAGAAERLYDLLETHLESRERAMRKHTAFSNLDSGTNYKFRIRAFGDGDYFVMSEFSSFLEVETDYDSGGDVIIPGDGDLD